MTEDDGTFSAFCVYEASGPEVLMEHAEALRLPDGRDQAACQDGRRRRVRTLGALLAERAARWSAATPSWRRCATARRSTVVHGVAGSGKSSLLRAFRAE